MISYQKKFVCYCLGGCFGALILSSFPSTPASALDVIPGLKGFGTDTRAAYGADNPPEICIVDSLGLSNGTLSWDESTYSVGVFRGTFKECIELNTLVGGTVDGHTVLPSSGKIILFEVSGTIHQDVSPYDYTVDFPHTHIAGQTAPDPGITLRNIHFQMAASNSVLQHIRSRVGDAVAGHDPGNRRSITVKSTTAGNPVDSIVVDHVTATWGVDTCFTVWESPSNAITNVTVSNCFIAEGLHDSIHPDTIAPDGHGHSKGLALQIRSTRISAIGNLIMNNNDRNPYVRWGSKVVVNNYTYNGEISNMSVTAIAGTIDLSAVGNVIETGPVTSGWGFNGFVRLQNDPEDSANWDSSNIYLLDNKYDTYTQTDSSDWSTVWNRFNDDVGPYKVVGEIPSVDAPLWPSGLVAMQSSLVKAYVIANAGSRPAQRDSVDARLVNDIINGTGVIIDSPSDVGGWPVLAENSITLQIPSNPHADDDNDGYTNLEEWLHGQAAIVEGKSSCQGQGYQCCDAGDCQSGHHAEYDGDCAGQLCCETCGGTEDTCADLGGTCCSYSQSCEGGSFQSSSNCGELCCVGGVCSGYTIMMASQPPLIDGLLGEYQGVPEIEIVNPDTGAIGVYRLVWDDVALYIAVEVLDNDLVAEITEHDGYLWSDDGLEIMFDTLHDGGATRGTDDYKIIVNLLETHGDWVGAGQSEWDPAYTAAVDLLGGTLNDTSDSDTGYTIEIAVPWSEWGIASPSSGTSWGMDVTLNDNVEGVRHPATWWNSNGGGMNDPDGWGTAIFSDEEPLVCPPGYVDCNGDPDDGCETNVDTDVNNCGDCGNECSAGKVCSRGECLDQCASDLEDCNGSCVDLDTDSSHCGSCDNACDSGVECVAGKCASVTNPGPTCGCQSTGAGGDARGLALVAMLTMLLLVSLRRRS